MVEVPLSDAPVIVTERLELWLPQAGDIDTMIDIVTHEETARYLGANADRADHFTRFQRNSGSWLLFGYGGFIVRERGKPAPIGNCGVFHSFRGLGEDFDDHAEAGWIISADHTGTGYASEAMEAALAWFDEQHGPQPVMCVIEVGNEPSFALAARLGFEDARAATWPDGAEVRLLLRSA